MENNETENLNEAAAISQTAGAEEKTGEQAALGKFKDVRSLLKAYGALEAEFTKKCQKIRALEGEISTQRDKAEEGASAPQREGVEEGSEETAPAIAAFLARRGADGEISLALKQALGDKARVTEKEVLEAYSGLLEEARGKEREALSREREEIRVSAVRDYVKAVAKLSDAAPVLTDVGQVSVAPPIRPQSIEEAGALARSLFIKKLEN